MVTIDYLRLSITNDCNLNCLYCRPCTSHPFIPFEKQDEALSSEEMIDIVKVLVANGIRKVRITGGEPLLREDVVGLVEMLSRMKGLEEISMTTNGTFLAKRARQLKRAGLSRINISLDTLKRDKYIDITGKDCLNEVFQGIEEALYMEFLPVKLNVVIMKGINEDEVLDFAKLTLNEPLIVRFIECLPILNNYEFIPNNKIKQGIEWKFGKLKAKRGVHHGPAENFQIKNSLGGIGFISPLSQPFCNKCNRLRLTSTGLLRPCLFSDFEVDLNKALKEGREEEIKTLFEVAIKNKPKQHNLDFSTCHMYRIGG